MKAIKKILLALLVILVAIQFIHLKKNISSGPYANGIDKHYTVPKDVQVVLKRSCYDCHSNNTYYPWYNNIQPVAWLLAHDVNEGKEEINFDEFNNYSLSQKRHKLSDLSKEVKEGEMPMGIYTVIHRNAVLSQVEKQRLITWADSLKGTLN
ncbi:heme-binding domain-containing protein [Mucilaginibacter gossypii]|uniref:heme-binding domain-containing protein n=1 Tax=Mucilaginibacter gossypii TaxID=551996 RepID=UPI000DCEB6D3|nr:MULTISPECIES: heme-binding domain-containing protein [Mucilaginibacter]QTE38461.1 heme-binding domain-containing protein [Mucilaginibacter gossypii]RAV59696.1 cytochrome C [Mucilaginibacter rubeus]